MEPLRAQRLIVAGLQTNVCIEATVRAAREHNYDVAVAEDAVSTDGPDLHHGALDSMRVLYVEVAGWRELLAPGARWDRAYTTANDGRDPAYWTEPDH
ncbi:cysteine hydrolase family protein [Nocardia wallacei]|uniref:cysteine hydrolase family protein n=1 Tax=Nocardia wallacei TaxID=480035 RepID=UPI003CC7E03D